jgi:hypothetical protein
MEVQTRTDETCACAVAISVQTPVLVLVHHHVEMEGATSSRMSTGSVFKVLDTSALSMFVLLSILYISLLN